MKLVIEISELDYKWITLRKGDETLYPLTLTVYDAIRNGTPLPKGHERLIDERQVVAALVYHDFLKDNVKCGDVTKILDMATIIEADKESEDKNEVSD